MVNSAFVSIVNKIVFSLQIFGLLPYTWREKAPSKGAVFSVKLFIWSFANIMLSLPGLFYCYLLIMNVKSSSVGNIALKICVVADLISLYFGEIVMFLKSKELVSALQGMMTITLLDVSGNIRRQFLIEFLTIAISSLSFSVFELVYGLHKPEVLDKPQTLCMFAFFNFFIFRITLLVFLFRVGFFTISQHLMDATAEAISECQLLGISKVSQHFMESHSSTQFHGNAEMKSDTSNEGNIDSTSNAVDPLHKLEDKAYRMEILRDQLADYFFEIITITLLVSISTIVTSSYAMLSNNWVKGGSLVFFIYSALILIYLCRVGQDFTKKIKEATRLLKLHSGSCEDRGIKEQVSLVLEAMSPLQQFTMCGWYTADFATLVSCLSQVVTYLVILLQVGWTTLGKGEG